MTDWNELANAARISACPEEIDDDRTPEEVEYVRIAQEPREQCTGGVWSGAYGSMPERCAYPAGHKGECEP